MTKKQLADKILEHVFKDDPILVDTFYDTDLRLLCSHKKLVLESALDFISDPSHSDCLISIHPGYFYFFDGCYLKYFFGEVRAVCGYCLMLGDEVL